MNNCLKDIIPGFVVAIMLTSGFGFAIYSLLALTVAIFSLFLFDVISRRKHCSLTNGYIFFPLEKNTLPCSLTGTNL